MNIRISEKYALALLVWVMQCVGSEEPSKLSFQLDTGELIPGKIHIEGKQTITATMGDAAGTPIIRVYINQQGPYFFSLATGTAETLISRRLAKKLNLPIKQTANAQEKLTNKAVELIKRTYMIEKLQIGDVILKDYGVISMGDDINNDEGFSSELRVDGLLSTNAFYGLLITLDFKNEQIQLEKAALSPQDNDVIPYSENYPIPAIQGIIKLVKLNREITQDLILSTGINMHVFINTCKIPEMMILKREGADKEYDLFEKKEVHFYARLLGDISLTNSIVINSPYVYFGEVNCGLAPVGILGRGFFERNKVTFDPKNRLVRMESINTNAQE